MIHSAFVFLLFAIAARTLYWTASLWVMAFAFWGVSGLMILRLFRYRKDEFFDDTL